MQSAFSE